jgi:hypothetical protein
MENYIFLGTSTFQIDAHHQQGCTQLNTHFFVNISGNENYTVDIPSQIYNVLINDKFIIDVSENVVIYSFNKRCEIIIIQHKNNPKNNIFGKENLETFFEVLLNANRDDSYIIQYDYEKKYYKTYHADTKIPIPKELKFSDSKIVNIITIKPILND